MLSTVHVHPYNTIQPAHLANAASAKPDHDVGDEVLTADKETAVFLAPALARWGPFLASPNTYV